jgi:hypothetical protein
MIVLSRRALVPGGANSDTMPWRDTVHRFNSDGLSPVSYMCTVGLLLYYGLSGSNFGSWRLSGREVAFSDFIPQRGLRVCMADQFCVESRMGASTDA